MSKQSSPTRHITRPAAAFRLRQLLDEIDMLMGAFPDLREAFDPDELPLEFILKRDSRKEPAGRRMRVAPAPVNAATRRMPAHALAHRGRPRKQMADE